MISPSFVRDIMKVNKGVPLIYCYQDDVKDLVENDMKDRLMELKDLAIKDKDPLNEILSSLPYDEMVLVFLGYGDFYKGDSREYAFIVKYSYLDTNYSYTLMDTKEMKVITMEDSDNAEYYKKWCLNMVCSMPVIFKKQNVVTVCTGATKKPVKGKIKREKSTFTVISSKKYLSKNKRARQTLKTGKTYAPHSVCAHWRNFYLETGKPESGIDYNRNGYDREKNPIKGRTWVKQGKTGAKDFEEILRIWRK